MRMGRIKIGDFGVISVFDGWYRGGEGIFLV